MPVSLRSCLGFACSKSKRLRIGIDPWPGYEVLYLADRRDLYGDLDVEIIEFTTLEDVRAAFEAVQIDVMCGTLRRSADDLGFGPSHAEDHARRRLFGRCRRGAGPPGVPAHGGSERVPTGGRGRRPSRGPAPASYRDDGHWPRDVGRDAPFTAFLEADVADGQRRAGTGLGLFITRQLVEAMGGAITASTSVIARTAITLLAS